MSDNVLTSEYMGLDSLLGSALSTDVPEDVVRGVSPWKKHMKLVFAGLILSFIAVELFPVDLIAGLAGFICLFLGFRRFASENRAFSACKWMSLAGLVCMLARVVVTTFSVRFERVRGDVNTAAEIISMVLMLLISVLYGVALIKAEKKAEKSIKASNAYMIPVWYIVVRVLCLLINLGAQGRMAFTHPFLWFVALAAALALFIHAIYKLIKELEEPGYAIRTSNPKVPDLAIAAGVVMITVILFVAGLFARNYPTKWQSWQQDLSSEAQTTKAELAAKGVDENILDILSEDELLLLSDGKVYTNKTESDPDAPDIDVYAIDVSGSWYRLISFEWPDGTEFTGTEGIAINAPLGAVMASDDPAGAVPYGNYISGRVVAADGAALKAAGLFIREDQEKSAYNVFNIDQPFYMFFGFSVPKDAEKVKGCVLMSYAPPEESYESLNTGVLYAHDTGKAKLIAVSAREDTIFHLKYWPAINETTQHKIYSFIDAIPYK